MTNIRACLPIVIMCDHWTGPDDEMDYSGPMLEIYWLGVGFSVTFSRRRGCRTKRDRSTGRDS